jgi:SpoVK/Ycf46/Vps4 family AAA+-type ATPase
MPIGKRIDTNNPSRTNRQVVSSDRLLAASENTALQAEKRPPAELPAYLVSEPKFTFDDIILHPSTYDAIQDVLTLFSKHDLVFNQWGLGKTHKQQRKAGINLYGASGTGKTMAAHAIAAQLGRGILPVDYSQIESKYVGETSKNITSLFDCAKRENAIIFFDEADALLSKRVTDMSSSTDVSVNQTRSHLLLLINDYDDIILFATNFITNYDPAFIRRISAHVKFELPDAQNRAALWRMYSPKQLPTDADFAILATDFDGVTGADISSAVLAAALKAARLGEDTVSQSYFEDAIRQLKQSKAANHEPEIISQRIVSEEYVKEQMGEV